MRPKSYIAGIIISFFLIFGITASTLCATVSIVLTNKQNYTEIIKNHNITDEAYNKIQNDFKEYSHESGIDSSVFTDEISRDFVENAVTENINIFAEAMQGKKINYKEQNLDDMNNAIKNHLTDYAQKNNYKIDDALDKKISEVTQYSDSIVNRDIDVMKLSSLSDEGILTKIPKFMSLFKILSIICYTFTAILLAVLFITKLKDNIIYWLGCNLFAAGFVLFVPLIYFKATDFFSKLSIKETGLYYTVTENANKILNNSLVISIIFFIIGIIFILFNIITGRKKLIK